MKRIITGLCLVGWVAASAQAQTCPDGTAVDAHNRAGNAEHCLVVRRIDPASVSVPKVLLVYLHGDNGGSTELSTTEGPAFRLAQSVGEPAIAVLRPGYRSRAGTSDGQTSTQDDDCAPGNVDVVADALSSLKNQNPGMRILLVGHSGGSAMSALVASRHPDAADGYLLAGCPCNVAPWREWRSASAGKSGAWHRSLSPQDEVAKIKPCAYLRLVVGTDDQNTLPKFSEDYVAALQANGVDARVSLARGATHRTVLNAPEFLTAAAEMAAQLSSRAP